MFQSFDATARPDQGPPRLAALRSAMAGEGLDGFLIPRADAHQGEYVAPGDERLAWLTGFTGSAGMCIALADRAAVFLDGRYRLQGRAQIAAEAYEPVDWPDITHADWLKSALPGGGRIGFDPWLHTREEIRRLETALKGSKITLLRAPNLVDRVWSDRPGPPAAPVSVQPEALAGLGSGSKRTRLGAELSADGQRAAVLTQPDAICWLLNIRGRDLPRLPVVQGFAILLASGRVDLFVAAPARFGPDLRATLGPEVAIHPTEAFAAALDALQGPVRLDPRAAPLAVADRLERAGIAITWAPCPCLLPKARKNAAELAGTRAAHLRDGAAMVRFLAWLDRAAPAGGLTEIALVRALEGFRRDTGALEDISFDTICGTGPNGAIVHYRVTEATDRALQRGELVLIDSGGQYRDGTTDITRTVAPWGTPPEEARAAYTRVLQGMIAVSRARWPRGLAGRDLDPLARYPLWLAGQDYDHGTGHGVGVFLSVHEGPQRLSRLSEQPLEPGMILSNEPGYYRAGAFGIRTENLVVVREAPVLEGADPRPMLTFETLTFVPLDRRLILREMVSLDERAWIDSYHAAVRQNLSDRLSAPDRAWLEAATAPL